MKIAMIGHKHFMTREGGVERVVSELAPRIQRKGNEVTVYDRFEIDKPYEKVNEKNGVSIKYAPTVSFGFLNAFLYSFSATIMSLFHHFDVVHYHAIGPSAMVWIQKLFGRKVIVTVHGLDWKRSKWSGFATRYLKFGERMAVKYADEIIVLSEADKKYFLNTYKRDTVLIRNGVESPIFKEAELIQKWNLKKGEYFLYLGRIVPEKNIDQLIDAFKEYEKQDNPFRKLVIAGELTEKNEHHRDIKKMAEADENILLIGAVDGDIVQELYNNCRAFILPSSVEGMSIALLEALSYGIPCVISDIKENCTIGLPYAYPFHLDKKPIGGAGSGMTCIMKPDSSQTLAEVLASVSKIETKNQTQMEYIKSNYDWNEVCLLTILEYEKVINHGK